MESVTVFLHPAIHIFEESYYLCFSSPKSEKKQNVEIIPIYFSQVRWFLPDTFLVYLILIAVLFQRWKDGDSSDLPRYMAGNAQASRLGSEQVSLWAPATSLLFIPQTPATALIVQVATWFPDPWTCPGHSLLDIIGQHWRKRWRLQPGSPPFRHCLTVTGTLWVFGTLWVRLEHQRTKQSNGISALVKLVHREGLHWSWGPCPHSQHPRGVWNQKLKS